MTAWITVFLHREWQRRSRWQWLLYPLACVYCILVSLRRWLYSIGVFASFTSPVPVIVIGNIYVGGTGKTPLIIALAQFLKKQGYKPGVISRGYGASYQGEVGVTQSANEVGDEPALIRQCADCPVVVHVKRSLALKQLLQLHPECDVVLSDDGLQHYALSRQLEIVVFDNLKGVGNGRCLPAGPLREGLSRLSSVSAIVLNKASDQDSNQINLPKDVPQFSMQLNGDELVSLKDASVRCSIQTMQDYPIHAVAGIGHPERFFSYLRRLGCQIIPHAFADHYRYESEDFKELISEPIVMTQKDAVKCKAFAQENWWYLPVDAQLPDAFYNHLLTLINHQEPKHNGR